VLIWCGKCGRRLNAAGQCPNAGCSRYVEEEPAKVNASFPAPLDGNGHLFSMQLPNDGRWLCLEPMTFGRARLCISHAPGQTAAAALAAGFGYWEIWEFNDLAVACVEFLERFNGREPARWTRHHVGGETERGEE
jgi:hypothetical protein